MLCYTILKILFGVSRLSHMYIHIHVFFLHSTQVISNSQKIVKVGAVVDRILETWWELLPYTERLLCLVVWCSMQFDICHPGTVFSEMVANRKDQLLSGSRWDWEPSMKPFVGLLSSPCLCIGTSSQNSVCGAAYTRSTPKPWRLCWEDSRSRWAPATGASRFPLGPSSPKAVLAKQGSLRALSSCNHTVWSGISVGTVRRIYIYIYIYIKIQKYT